MVELKRGHCTARSTILAAPPAMVKDRSGEGGQTAVRSNLIYDGVQPDVLQRGLAVMACRRYKFFWQGTLNEKNNLLYQCQSMFFHHYPKAHFYDTPRSGHSFTTCPGQLLEEMKTVMVVSMVVWDLVQETLKARGF